MITKLVRDWVGDIPWPDPYHGMPCGDALKVHLGRVEPGSAWYRRLLVDKLAEECVELADAYADRDFLAVTEEAADVLEAAVTMVAGTAGTSVEAALEAVLSTAARKRRERGGLVDGVTYSGPRPGRGGA